MLTRRFFILLSACILLALLGTIWGPMVIVAKYAAIGLCCLAVLDGAVAFTATRLVNVEREVPEHLSLGQPNKVSVKVTMRMPKDLTKRFDLICYDTLPRTFRLRGSDCFHGEGEFTYFVEPTSRGRHEFDIVRCFVFTRFLGLCEMRRFISQVEVVKVYPTFHNLEKLEILATTNATKVGAKRRRQAGNSTDFDQIRSYVPGDDVRTINWRATARAASPMVNTYTDERSQPIISVVCAGPSMLIATDGVTLLDRAASAAVALASSAVRHYDQAGLILLSHQGVDTYMQPERSPSTVARTLEKIYSFGLPPTDSEQQLIADPDVLPDDANPNTVKDLRQRMDVCSADADLEAFSAYALSKLKRKSLLLLFCNFENIEVARQALPALQRISKRHTLVVVLFENEGVNRIAKAPYRNDGSVSQKLSEKRFRAICADYIEQQQLLAAYLRKNHINVIFTPPTALTSAVLQKYIELKNKAIV